MSNAELLEPTTTHFLPAYASGPGVRGRVVLVAAEDVHAREVGQVRLAGHAGGEHQLLRAQRERLALALDLDVHSSFSGFQVALVAVVLDQ